MPTGYRSKYRDVSVFREIRRNNFKDIFSTIYCLKQAKLTCDDKNGRVVVGGRVMTGGRGHRSRLWNVENVGCTTELSDGYTGVFIL